MTERTDEAKLPRIFGVNWFRKGDDGRFLWPGFGDNSRVLEWICRRLDGDAGGVDTAIGVVPSAGDLELDGLDVSVDDVDAALAFDAAEWRQSVPESARVLRRVRRPPPARARRGARRARRTSVLAPPTLVASARSGFTPRSTLGVTRPTGVGP